ncbi:MAG: primosomal protein N' [Saprospiraceae bacterium]|nr:primosomal protein N' [Saprospiraceae bacterium]
MKPTFATVVFPLALPKLYTYSVPETFMDSIQVGIRVEVSLKNKSYAAIVVSLHNEVNESYKPKPIISILDKLPLISDLMLDFWKWIAQYYCCTLGEVMAVSLPAGMKLSSETNFVLNPLYEGDFMDLGEYEYMVAEAISIKNVITVNDVQSILNQKSIFTVIKNLLQAGVISVKEVLIEKYKPKKIRVVRLMDEWYSNEENFAEIFSLVKNSEKQTNAMLGYFQLSRSGSKEIPVSEIYKLTGADSTVLSALSKKKIIEIFEKEITRLGKPDIAELESLPELSTVQNEVLDKVYHFFELKLPVLLHGVTGSGKTLVYTHLIHKYRSEGKQVLYLLPEIALTTQTVEKIQKYTSEKVLVYHSRMNNNERVELWNAVREGSGIVLGARSSLFLPFYSLGLIIVDEEHDPSYKQQDPNPRYNARDAAIYLAFLSKANVLMGSATPSLESFYNAKQGKYGLVEISERFGLSSLPTLQVVDLKKEVKDQRFEGMISQTLKEAIENALAKKEQVILFQNRRGFAPTYHCKTCGWKAMCQNCDVHLTLHKAHHSLRCHYCGYKITLIKVCPACGSQTLEEVGFGTEKIEHSIELMFPGAKVARLDMDNASTKSAMENILMDFEYHETDILVGTQMLTKGLDFGNVSVVGILLADSLLRYPDLRAGERAYQLMTQVSGRSGRREKPGLVIIQTFQVNHPVIRETLHHDYLSFFERESDERKKFLYPPYYRLIFLEIAHKNASKADAAAMQMAIFLKEKLTNRILGPAPGSIPRLRGQYIYQILIKMENTPAILSGIKSYILECRVKLFEIKTYRDVKIVIDVDPY